MNLNVKFLPVRRGPVYVRITSTRYIYNKVNQFECTDTRNYVPTTVPSINDLGLYDAEACWNSKFHGVTVLIQNSSRITKILPNNKSLKCYVMSCHLISYVFYVLLLIY